MVLRTVICQGKFVIVFAVIRLVYVGMNLVLIMDFCLDDESV
jgi:hypothetical protein